MFRDLHDDINNYSSEPDKYLDVPFVPTDEAVIEAMIKLAKISPKDLVYDLGSGDGRILITAARDRSARGIGIEIDPVRIADAMEEAGWAGVESLVDFIEEDIFDADFKDATVVTLYLLESVNLQLRPQLLSQLRPGTRIVSHAFHMGDWKADDQLKLNGVNIYKWIVPAQVAGVWNWECTEGRSYRIEIQQKYQDVTGTVWLNDEKAHLNSITLCGERLDLEIRGQNEAAPSSFALMFENSELKSTAPDE